MNKVFQAHLTVESFSGRKFDELMVYGILFLSTEVLNVLKSHTLFKSFSIRNLNLYETDQNRDGMIQKPDDSLSFPVGPLGRYLKTPREPCGTI